MKKPILPLLFCLLPTIAAAHSLHVVAQQQGRQLQGDAYYSDMKPAAEHYLGIFEAANPAEPVLESMTDKNGHIALTLPQETDYVLVVEGMEGHKASINVPRIGATAHTPDSGAADEFNQLRKDIAQLKEKIYWHDILGGIGYIFGIFGVIVLLRRGKR